MKRPLLLFAGCLALGAVLIAHSTAAQDAAEAETAPLPPVVKEIVEQELGLENVRSVSVSYRIRTGDGRYMTVMVNDGELKQISLRIQYENTPEAVRKAVVAENGGAPDVRFVQKALDPETGEGTFTLVWRGNGGTNHMQVREDGMIVRLVRAGLEPADLPAPARQALEKLLGPREITRLRLHVDDGERTYRARAEGVKGYAIVGPDGKVIKDPRGVMGTLPKNELP
jgi:hypothetical protein